MIAGSLPEALKPFDLLSFGENPIIANTITTNQHRQTDCMKLTARFRNYQKKQKKIRRYFFLIIDSFLITQERAGWLYKENDMDWIEEMGIRIGDLRRAKGLKQSDIADKLDTVAHSVSRWECGERLITTDKLRKLAILLNTSVDYLMFGDKDEQK